MKFELDSSPHLPDAGLVTVPSRYAVFDKSFERDAAFEYANIITLGHSGYVIFVKSVIGVELLLSFRISILIVGKKICHAMAGSALLQNEALVAQILETVVAAVSVPVTLKIRTGWDTKNRNAVRIAQIAEISGIQALAIHGRTRACAYTGEAEYDTIAAVKASVKIPVIANGDITTPEKAHYVLEYTGADAVMIGRAAQGRPWLFREIAHFLETGVRLPAPQVDEIQRVLLNHLHGLYDLYGERTGLRVARKHISWYTKGLADSAQFRHYMNQLESIAEQLIAVNDFFAGQLQRGERLHYAEELAA